MKVTVRVANATLAAELRAVLEQNGHVVIEGRGDVVVVDDVATLARLRAKDPALPILVMNAGAADPARDALERVAALRAGADDAMTFTPSRPAAHEMSQAGARVDALGRRAMMTPHVAHDVVDADGCHIDLEALTATRDADAGAGAGAVVVELTPREVAIVRFLHRHRDRAVTRAELLVGVWGASAEMETRTVDMTIARLRKKIERDAAAPAIVVSVKGTGYRFGA